MKLSGKEFERIQAALLDAYPRRDALRNMVRIELDESIDEISSDRNLEIAIHDLIVWAESTERIGDLIAGARRQNPGNAALRQIGYPSKYFNVASSATTQLPPKKIGCTITIGFVSMLIVFLLGWYVFYSEHGLLDWEVITSRLWPVPTPTPEVAPAAGATKINPKDGAVYVYVPAGQFIMGSSDDDPVASDGEKPQQALSLDAFWIMRTEVTNAQYARCVQAGVCTEPYNDRWNDAAYAQHPVTDVSWHEANEYAQWVGGRLPTEAEWEKACRSTDGRLYPWGDEPPTGDLTNFDYFDYSIGSTTLVGSYPKGASPYGVLDMAGNAWEWTSSKYGNYPYARNDGREEQTGIEFRVLRGGKFFYNGKDVRCAARVRDYPDDVSRLLGFRVVLSP